jgi:hypothetical protein
LSIMPTARPTANPPNSIEIAKTIFIPVLLERKGTTRVDEIFNCIRPYTIRLMKLLILLSSVIYRGVRACAQGNKELLAGERTKKVKFDMAAGSAE